SSIGQFFDDSESVPGFSAIGALGAASAGVFGALSPVDAGVVVDGAVGTFGDGGCTGAVRGEGFAVLPGLAAVVAVHGVGVVGVPELAAVAVAVVAGGTQESSGVLAVAEGDARLVHVEGGDVSEAVGLDVDVLFFPGCALVFASEDFLGRRR